MRRKPTIQAVRGGRSRQAEAIAGIVLRRQPLGERDLIVEILDPERGLVAVIARSARGSSRRFGGALAAFAEIEALAVLRPGGLGDLREARAIDLHLEIAGAWHRLVFASWALELARVSAQPGQPEPELCAWLGGCLTAAAGLEARDLAGLHVAAAVAWLGLQGSLPEVERCAVCGSPLAGGALWLRAGEGLVCAGCGRDGSARLEPGDLTALARLRRARPGLTLAREASLSPLAWRRILDLLAEVVHVPLRSEAALEEALLAVERQGVEG